MSTLTSIYQAIAPVVPRVSRLRPLGVPDVRVDGGFWGELQDLNTVAIIPHAAEWMERLGWFANLEQAGAGARYEHRGREFADSEVYKLIEALSWDVARRGEAGPSELLDRLIALVSAAQEPDGYLHTLFGRPWQRPRYSDFKWGHELYCFGHLIQAAVANHRSTRDERLLTVARRLADHVCIMFGIDGLHQVCGHPEIEVSLVELFRETGDARYLHQASLFVERRGVGTLPLFEFGPAYWQDEMAVRDAEVLRGHAVRALYLAAGAVDVAVEAGDEGLHDAVERQWANTVARRTYITGGMGSHHMDEAFGEDFVLPPDRSYNETCAGIASIMLSWRLLLETGEAKYADLIERTLYNVVATSPSADGRAFFYANTLHQRAEHVPPAFNDDGVVIRGGASGRQPWYEVSCCPPNVARTLASLSGYFATEDESGLQLHQFASSRIRGSRAEITVDSVYPRDGVISILVNSAEDPFTVSVRIPAWANNSVARVNGVEAAVASGQYAQFTGLRTGDTVVIELPMAPRFIEPDDRIDAIRDTVAVERGPEVFALESIDLPGGWALEDVAVSAEGSPHAHGEGVSVDVVRRLRASEAAWPYGIQTEARVERSLVRLIPYRAWANRGSSTMRVWIPTERKRTAPTL